MTSKEIIRHIIGYAVGILIFFVIIPYTLYKIADAYELEFIHPTYNWLRLTIALVLSLIGFTFVLWSNAALFFIGKGGPTDGLGIAISPRTKHLVTTGPYRYTRNPMVFGALCCYIAWGIYLNSLAVIAIVICVTPLFMWYLQKTEEKRLLRDFGEDFIEYRKQVPILFPKFSLKKKN